MTSHPDWDRTLDNVAWMVSHDMCTVEEGRRIFESCTGFRPDTGKPTPVHRRWSERFGRWLAGMRQSD